MFSRPLRRALLRLGAVTTAAMIAFGGVATTALGQEPDPPEAPTSAPVSSSAETTTPPPTSSSEQAPPSAGRPKPAAAPAALRTTVEFDERHYLLHENMRIKFTITNIGEQAAERVRFPFPLGSPMYDRWNWAPLSSSGDGIRVGPGETRVLEFSGAVADRYDWQNRTAGFTDRYLDFVGRTDNREDRFGAVATVTPTAGDVRGVVYGDGNHNGRQDAGEALAGTTVTIWGAYGNRASRVTDAEGRFLFEKVEGGPWLAGYSHPGGWVVPRGDGSVQDLVVTPDGVELSVRAEWPASDSIEAALTLDKATYQVGEPVTITAALTNRGARPVEGVQVFCRDFGDEYLGPEVDWGDLRPTGPGVTIAAGETRTFSVADVVRQRAADVGEVVAICLFGPQVLQTRGEAEATARAAVPGGVGSVTGLVWHDENNANGYDEGEGVGGVRVVLRGKYTDAVVAEAVSDAAGQLRFDHVPAGWYLVRVEGPWTARASSDREVQVTTVREARLRIAVDPVVDEPWPPTPGPLPPAHGGAVAPEPSTRVVLARTGASLLGLGLLGAVLVAFGAGALTASRNREAGSRSRA